MGTREEEAFSLWKGLTQAGPPAQSAEEVRLTAQCHLF